MPSVSVVAPTSAIRADAVVIGVHQSSSGPAVAAGGEPVGAALDGRLPDALTALGATGRVGRGAAHPDPGARRLPPRRRHRPRPRAAGDDEAAEAVRRGRRRRPARADRQAPRARRARRRLPARWPRARCSAPTGSPTYKSRASRAELRTIAVAAPTLGPVRGAACDRRRRGRLPRPRPGQHAAQRPLPRDLRGPRRGTGRRAGAHGRGARRARAQAQGLRRHPRRRAGQRAAAAAGADQLPHGEGPRPPGAGRQGRHVRLRRAQPQDGRTWPR